MKRNFLMHVASVTVCLTCISVFGVASAIEKEEVPRATVELVVRSPEGRPLANTEVEVRSGEDFFPNEERPSASGKTNAQGRIHFFWPVGLHRLDVIVKGIGYGATGRFELLEEGTARPALAPLVPLGAIEGTVPKDSLQAGVYVQATAGGQMSQRRATCDSLGRFVFADLPAGEYLLLLEPSSRRIRSGISVAVRPGQRVRGVTVHKDATATVSRQEAMMFGMQPSQAKEILWAAGTVRDEDGHPMEGADVFAVINYYGGIRMYEEILSVKTDKRGRWTFRGSDSLSAFNGTLIACKAGHPYTCASMQSPIPDETNGQPKQPDLSHYELVLPARGGSLQATVLQDGRALKDAVVKLARPHGPVIYERGYMGGDRSPHRQEVEQWLTPSATTDREGIARFTDLVPDEYRLTAFAGSREEIHLLDSPILRSGSKKPFAEIGSVAIQAGKTAKCSVSVYPPPNYRVPIKVLRPDGRPYAKKEMQISGTDEWPQQAATEPPTGDNVWLYSLYGAGLHHIEFLAANPLAHRDRADDLPHEEVSATIGVSPILPERPAAVLTVATRELGSLVVQLRGPAGKPLQAYVLVDRNPFAEIPAFAGTTDDRGEVRFEGIEPKTHQVEAFPAGQAFPDLPAGDGPLPTDKDLLGRMIVQSQEVTTPAGVETRLTVCAKPAGYVRGTLRPPPGRQVDDYYLTCDDWHQLLGFSAHFDRKSGEFLLGLLPEGKATLYAAQSHAKRSDELPEHQDVSVSGSHVTRVEFNLPAESAKGNPAHRPQQAFLGMGGILMLGQGSPGSRGRVYLNGGKTPVYGAVLAYFVPDTIPPVGAGETDALGRIFVAVTWYSGGETEHVPPGSPTVPVLVTWLSGSCGATITPIKDEADAKELKIVLPRPLAVAGKVTVGGKEVHGQQCELRVVAIYEGKGKLARVLSRSASVEKDGRFALTALTPGTYRVQAVLDNIWLSPSVLLKVTAEAVELGPLILDIGQPGPATILKVVNQAGKPMRDAWAAVARPEGPLADSLWPDHFTSDGAGVLHLPPLEAGIHKVRVRGAKERAIVVPPLADVNAVEVEPPIIVQ